MTDNMMRWKAVVGWEDYYEVPDRGEVRSFERIARGPYGSTPVKNARMLKQQIGTGGYPMVTLQGGGRKRVTRPVHRLVLEAFVGPCPDGMVACHGPGGPEDNRIENLRWDTQSENVRDQLRHGTHPSGATLETCGRGHAYTPENTYWVRKCKTCNNRRDNNLGQQIAALFTEGA